MTGNILSQFTRKYSAIQISGSSLFCEYYMLFIVWTNVQLIRCRGICNCRVCLQGDSLIKVRKLYRVSLPFIFDFICCTNLS
uniref:Uncharacterized protein n=1 Tax=Arundo donax TaxID=35708 RepID=A0A0A9E7G1_ARUDO